MKKAMMITAAAILLLSCGKDVLPEPTPQNCKEVTFTLQGDFSSPVFTRTLNADGSDMTDIWVFDFVDEQCIQYVHQSQDDDSFGEPSVTLENGDHILCFVASRGDTPTLDITNNTITWNRPSDTFWADMNMAVTPSTPGDVAVTLNRVSTKLRLLVTDAVPQGIATLTTTPEKWYYGLNYWFGTPATMKTSQPRTVSVPSSYAGTTGQLVMSIYGMSTITEWTTDVVLTAKDGNGTTIGTASISNAPMKANRQTQYSGRLFTSDGLFTLTLNDEWLDAYTGEW